MAVEESASFWDLIEKKSEIISLKSEIQRLESVIQNERQSFIKKEVDLRKEIDNLQQEVKNEKERGIQFKREINAKNEKIDACNEQLASMRDEFGKEKEFYEKRLIETEKLNQTLKSANNDLNLKIESLKRQHINELMERDNLIVCLRTDFENFQKEKEIYLKRIETLHSDLKNSNELESKFHRLVEENKTLKDQLKEYSEAKKLTDIFQEELKDLPHIEKLKNREEALNVELLFHKSKLEESSKQISEVLEKYASLEKEVETLNTKILDLDQQNKKLSKKCLLFCKERDAYKKIIDGYENEITIAGTDAALRERIADLESTLQEYRSLIQPLESGMTKEISDEPKRKKLKEDNENVENSDSLESQAKNKEEHLEVIEENKRLKLLLKQLESKVNSKGEEKVKSEEEVKELKQQLNIAEKKRVHIMEAFKKTSKEFREVVYILTGYRIDALKQKIYRLSHVYAESQNDVLLFELENNGNMKLQNNEYSEKLAPLINNYINKYDSFPAFLSALTMDLFQKQTHIQNNSTFNETLN
ncbi:mitotic spindle assembly checkpoint protein MAD1-like protein [Dinothrombium tinctorium]|uniref:Mitotic spindle assembly checkpoint protein MAD1-like protein n=1 Tax=Dinothrombium tinctorium TaxID=1965070 RepID=A0A3S3RT17_9ACAR|nr:mitotic spindle assembly checkpoint protein MAD1-like protein [Dinothrombium tinctorium]RWS04302.1 mitotic spindle assembly checkpoint protein MAD1-like protein [Dinothrombium tinctorium]